MEEGAALENEDAAWAPALPEEWTRALLYSVLLPALKLSPHQLLELTKVLYFGSLNLMHLQRVFLEAPRVLATDLPVHQLAEVSEVLRREGVVHEIIHAGMVKEPAISERMRWKPGSR